MIAGGGVLGVQFWVKAICKDQVLDMADECSHFSFFVGHLAAPFLFGHMEKLALLAKRAATGMSSGERYAESFVGAIQGKDGDFYGVVNHQFFCLGL
jgi:hypothetical protein